MIRLYKDSSKFSKDNTIVDSEEFFKEFVAPKSFTDLSLKVMKNIDGAILLDWDVGTIQTPFGVTDIDHLSTGCKTVLNYIYIASRSEKYSEIKAIDAAECGWNAIEELFKTMDLLKYNIGIIIKHNNDLIKCSNREYLVNDKKVIQSLFMF